MLTPTEIDHYALAYGPWWPYLALIGLGRRRSGVEVERDTIAIRMGPAFHARLPLSSVGSVRSIHGRSWFVGVRSHRGAWTVQGATRPIVAIELTTDARARALGIPMRLRSMRIALAEAERFVASFPVAQD